MSNLKQFTFSDDFTNKLNFSLNQLLQEHNNLITQFNTKSSAIQAYFKAKELISECDLIVEKQESIIQKHGKVLQNAMNAQIDYEKTNALKTNLEQQIKILQIANKTAQSFVVKKFWPYYWNTICAFFDHIIDHRSDPFYEDNYIYPKHFTKMAINWNILITVVGITPILSVCLLSVPFYFSVILPIIISLACLLITAVTVIVALRISKELNEQNARQIAEAIATKDSTAKELGVKAEELEKAEKEIESLFTKINAAILEADDVSRTTDNPDAAAQSEKRIVPSDNNNLSIFSASSNTLCTEAQNQPSQVNGR